MEREAEALVFTAQLTSVKGPKRLLIKGSGRDGEVQELCVVLIFTAVVEVVYGPRRGPEGVTKV